MYYLRFWCLDSFVPSRRIIADPSAPAGADALLTTGEAARILGTSRQHIVDLCSAGELPFTTVGKHRRIRREDLESLRDSGVRMTRDQVRSLLLAYAVAGHVVADPESSLALARRNLERMRVTASRGAARVWFEEWSKLLDGPLTDLLRALTSHSVRSRELRQNSPFAGILAEDERRSVLAVVPMARMKQSH